MTTLLLLGSAPIASAARDWPRAPFDSIVAINNAHSLRADWDFLVFPWDFPTTGLPTPARHQRLIDETAFVPAQNAMGGFVYAGGTMAYTAAYWALHSLRPKVIAAYGCDMHYPAKGPTHFYGTGRPDPLRTDISLRSLEAKSARLMVLAALQGCAMVNLSTGPSRLMFPRAARDSAHTCLPARYNRDRAKQALRRETQLGYYVPSGRYWLESARFDPAEIDALDQLWLEAATDQGPRAADQGPRTTGACTPPPPPHKQKQTVPDRAANETCQLQHQRHQSPD